MKLKSPVRERRQWPRLPLPIPVFVRSWLDSGPESLEFATALNVSAGGMLLAVRRMLPSAANISLEIPSAPIAALAALPQAARNLRARIMRTEAGQSYSLIALKFAHPLIAKTESPAGIELPRPLKVARRTKFSTVAG